MYNVEKNNKKFNILDRTLDFGVKIIKLIDLIPKTQAGFILSRQLVRSATSVGANIEEAQSSPTKKDFVNKMNIALKEARETRYWLTLLSKAKLLSINRTQFEIEESKEIIKIIITIIKKTKNGM